MNQDFNQCLESKKIIPFARGKSLSRKNYQSPKAICQMQKRALITSDTNGQPFKPTTPCSTRLEPLSTLKAIVKRVTIALP